MQIQDAMAAVGMNEALTAREYDAAEADGSAVLANRVVESFQPVTFGAVGYPARVERDEALWKFVDVMHERRFEQNFHHLLDGMSRDEFRLFQEVNEIVAQSTAARFGKVRVARASLLRAVNVLRHIRFVYGDARPPVLEIGAGSGYLGALLLLDGYPVISTDVAQGFYLYQNVLWSEIAPGSIRELARETTPLHALRTPEPGQLIHIPWWHFYDPNFELSRLAVGVITCNHVLCEMHPRSLYYLMLLGRHLMTETEVAPSFLFEGWGSDVNLPLWYVNSRFYRYGLGMCHNDARVTVFAEADKAGGHARYPHFEMTNFDNASQIQNYAKTEIGQIWEPRAFATTENVFSAKILAGRQEHERSVGLDTVVEFLSDLTGERDYETEDERFWRLLDVS